jgi:hypothetical protein
MGLFELFASYNAQVRMAAIVGIPRDMVPRRLISHLCIDVAGQDAVSAQYDVDPCHTFEFRVQNDHKL